MSEQQFLPPCSRQTGVILSGIGGWEVGLQEAGWQIAYSVEKNHGKASVLRRNMAQVVSTEMLTTPIHNGLFVMGGLPEHTGKGVFWDSCMHALQCSEARWVILETVHTVLREKPWPGAIGRMQKDLYDAGYATLWCVVIYGNKNPIIRWSRLIMIGWPMEWSIPTQLSMCHGQAILMNDVEVGVNVQCGQTYPRYDMTSWMRTIGFPEGWLAERELQEDYLTVATIPTVATNIGRMLLSADKYMIQLIEPASSDGA